METKLEGRRPDLPVGSSLAERRAFFENLAELLDAEKYSVPQSIQEYFGRMNEASAFNDMTAESMIHEFIADFADGRVTVESLEQMPLTEIVRLFERTLIEQRTSSTKPH